MDPYSGYGVEVDTLSKDAWEKAIQGFEDVSIFQTRTWGTVWAGEDKLSHMTLKDGNEILAMAQVKITRVPLLGAGLAVVSEGPLWRRSGTEVDPEALHFMLRSLREEYAEKRNLLLTVKPNISSFMTEDMPSIFQEEGFCPSSFRAPYHTMVMNMPSSTEAFLRMVKRQWRQNLNRAQEDPHLRIIEGVGMDLFEMVNSLYREMLVRKQFTNIADMGFYRVVQQELPDPLKMKIMICTYDDEPIAGLITSDAGKMAKALIAATGDRGARLHGSYLMWWKMIESLRERGCTWYDLCGINRHTNPGGYQFKSGLCGKMGKEVLISEYSNCTSRLSQVVVQVGEYAKGTRNRIAGCIAPGFRIAHSGAQK